MAHTFHAEAQARAEREALERKRAEDERAARVEAQFQKDLHSYKSAVENNSAHMASKGLYTYELSLGDAGDRANRIASALSATFGDCDVEVTTKEHDDDYGGSRHITYFRLSWT